LLLPFATWVTGGVTAPGVGGEGVGGGVAARSALLRGEHRSHRRETGFVDAKTGVLAPGGGFLAPQTGLADGETRFVGRRTRFSAPRTRLAPRRTSVARERTWFSRRRSRSLATRNRAAPGQFSTSTQVKGKIYAADYATPTPTNLLTAIQDMGLAYTDAAGRAASVTELGAGNIGGMTLAPGVFKWGSGVLIPSNLTLTGSSTGVWIFQIAQTLTVSNGTIISLTGGAVPKNVFWQVAGDTSIGTTAQFAGVLLDQTQIAVGTGASINGRLLAQTAVTLQSNSVVQPAP
jgi:hypothetical protein